MFEENKLPQLLAPIPDGLGLADRVAVTSAEAFSEANSQFLQDRGLGLFF